MGPRLVLTLAITTSAALMSSWAATAAAPPTPALQAQRQAKALRNQVRTLRERVIDLQAHVADVQSQLIDRLSDVTVDVVANAILP